ncbi:hypothetical protein [Curtobacterium sp. 'Ferrero']|uniref:hypothetical protein n=1 Tax=Curtobacterium sp. 'Ferrero' TaxID=2033654 RepID=UPI0015967083|nr:hypothetical protein [Curtobacterium sp. 'Ferrero']
MSGRTSIEELRRDPREWNRRGLTHPAVLRAMVTARVNGHDGPAQEPTYADFFSG